MGATLNFTISTDNSQDPATLSLTGFDYVEIPAPLPISGACMFFASSRRLRRRLRKSSQNDANSNSAGAPGNFTHPGASYSSAIPAAIHRYSARLGLSLPDGQGPVRLRATSLHAAGNTRAIGLQPSAPHSINRCRAFPCNAPVSKSNSE